MHWIATKFGHQAGPHSSLSGALADVGFQNPAQKLKPGAPQQPWVQAQTTFAVLARDENKQWQVRALKQKLLVDTVNYEIQVRPLQSSGDPVLLWRHVLMMP